MINPDTFATLVEEWELHTAELRADMQGFALGIRSRQNYTETHAIEMIDQIIERTEKISRAFNALKHFVALKNFAAERVQQLDSQVLIGGHDSSAAFGPMPPQITVDSELGSTRNSNGDWVPEAQVTASVAPNSKATLSVDWDDIPNDRPGTVCLTIVDDGFPVGAIYVDEAQLKMILNTEA